MLLKSSTLRAEEPSQSRSCVLAWGGVGILVKERLLVDVTIITNVNCNETIRLRIRIRTGVDLHIGCAYL